jgi:hypothetical protein
MSESGEENDLDANETAPEPDLSVYEVAAEVVLRELFLELKENKSMSKLLRMSHIRSRVEEKIEEKIPDELWNESFRPICTDMMLKKMEKLSPFESESESESKGIVKHRKKSEGKSSKRRSRAPQMRGSKTKKRLSGEEKTLQMLTSGLRKCKLMYDSIVNLVIILFARSYSLFVSFVEFLMHQYTNIGTLVCTKGCEKLRFFLKRSNIL